MKEKIIEEAKKFLKKRNKQGKTILMSENEAISALIDFAMKISHQWISVEDRLPPVDQYVLVRCKNKNKEGGIWLYDVCMFDGEMWSGRSNWENIIDWKIIT